MAYSQTSPGQSDDVFMYERGTQTILISGATGTATQTGTAKPTSANAIGIFASASNSIQPANCVVQVDLNAAGGTGATSAYTINLLGSLDGTRFYVLATFTGTTTGAIFPVGEAAGCRYLSASITTFTIGSGAPDLTVTIAL